jgi:hypothetical protein
MMGGITQEYSCGKGTTMYEKLIWDALITFLKNPIGAAALMGNLEAESDLDPTNLENSYERKLGLTDAQYTAAVDNGTYKGFVTDSAGFGLAQWTYAPRKKGLLDYVKNKGVSIGDCVAQLEYLCIELTRYPAVFSALRNATAIRPASDVVLEQFENPADKSEKVKAYRASLGEKWYQKYAVTATTPVESVEQAGERCTPDAVIAVAIGELGYHEKASNAALDDKDANAGGNNFTKYARDFDQKYPNWYNGKKNGFAWCDMFTDWCFLTAYGYENALRLLCQPERSAGAGCTYSLQYFRAAGQFHQYDPQPGDQIFFGTSLSNSTHTGLVEKVENGCVYTIEGNSSDQVSRRRYALTDSNILGYGRPAYDAVLSTAVQAEAAPTEYVSVNLPVLGKGMTALSIAAAQVLLIRHGYSCGGKIVNGVEQPDGEYGSATEEAVRSFQQKKGIDADGVIRADTWAALLGVKT